MLRPKVIPKVLEQGNSNHVEATLLINTEGSLVSCAPTDYAHSQAVAAIVQNIWTFYTQANKNYVASSEDDEQDQDSLQTLLIDCDQGRLGVTAVTNMLVCIVGNRNAQPGMLKAKLEVFQKNMVEPLSQIQY